MAGFKESDEANAGLCASCRHVKKNRSDRGSVFYYCSKSETDPAFSKYPSLPVLNCCGYEAASGSSSPSR